MNIRRTLAFTKRSLLQFRHDRRTLAFILIMPLLMMLIFGYTFGGEPKGLKVAVVNHDVGIASPLLAGNISFASLIINNLDDEMFVLIDHDDMETASANLNDAKVWGVLYFPANFTSGLAERFSPTSNSSAASRIWIYLDDTNPNIASAVVKGIREGLLETTDDIIVTFDLPAEVDPVVIEVVNNYAVEDIEFIDYFAPGIICFAIMMVTVMITIILFVNERRTGTLERLLASPADESEIVLGYALAFGVIGLCQSTVILIVAILIFDITIVGNVLLALFVVMLLAVGHQGLGILLSSAAKNELQAIQFIPLIIFPSVLLAGLFWPIESIPSYLQPLSHFIPLKYGIAAERAIMLKGWGIGDIWVEILVLILFATMTLTASIIMLKRRKD